MQDVRDLADRLEPQNTALFLGAGASMPSGAPSGQQLARRLAKQLRIDDADLSLAEVCSLFERREGRSALATAVADALRPIEPAGGLLLLPRFSWYRIYSTNFDLLVEKAYRKAGVELAIKRSNFDFSRDPDASQCFYKIHGCLTEDVGFGHQSRMLLTDADYEEYSSFREASFKALAYDLLTKDVLVVGQSLADPHLKETINETLRIKNRSATPGRVFVLAYRRDDTRADLLRSRGMEVYFGDLDSFFQALTEVAPPAEPTSFVSDAKTSLLPAELVSVTVDVAHAIRLAPNARAVFNGSPATYADIVAKYTFDRALQAKIVAGLNERPISVILGAGGVGKTTLARRVMVELMSEMDSAWEHSNVFPFQAKFWVEYETRLRETGGKAGLLVDDCVDNLAQVSQLLDHVGRLDNPALRIVLTATTGKWVQRSKSRYIFSHGEANTLSALTREDLEHLLALLDEQPAIRELVDQRFLSMAPGEKMRTLTDRCSADMYVCMKNIFASEELDFILLREYGELDPAAQDIYRNVSALQALGARVHRQLIMRLLAMEAGGLQAILTSLTGVVTEFDIKPRDGLFGWETRHRVVAEKITDYKFAKQDERGRLFEDLIDSINPSVRLELESAKALCTEEYGIASLTDGARQAALLRSVIDLLPGEPIPRHRLVRRLIDLEKLDEAAHELKQAVEGVGKTPVLQRYEVLIALRQATLVQGLMDEDRMAILLGAESKAQRLVERSPKDKHNYRILGDVAVAIGRRGGDLEHLERAISKAREGEDLILDPTHIEMRRSLEDWLRRLRATRTSAEEE